MPHVAKRFTRSEWIALFMSEITQSRPLERLSSRSARAIAERSMAAHPDLSPTEAARLRLGVRTP